MTRHDPAGGVDDAATLERASALGDAESAGLSEGRATTRRRPLLRSARFWVPVGILLVLIALAVFAFAAASKAFAAKDTLEEAIPLASELKAQVLAQDLDGAEATLAELAVSTSEAEEIVNDPVWRVSEVVPIVGPNFSAVREMVAAVLEELVARFDPPRIGAVVFQDNLPSCRVLEGLGFARAGQMSLQSRGRDAPAPAILYLREAETQG